MRKINLNNPIFWGLSVFQIWQIVVISLMLVVVGGLTWKVRSIDKKVKAAEERDVARQGLLEGTSRDNLAIREFLGVDSRMAQVMKEVLPPPTVRVGNPPQSDRPTGSEGQPSGDSRQPAGLPPARPTGVTPQVAPAPRYGRNDAATPPQAWPAPPSHTEPQLPPPPWLDPLNTTTFPGSPAALVPAQPDAIRGTFPTDTVSDTQVESDLEEEPPPSTTTGYAAIDQKLVEYSIAYHEIAATDGRDAANAYWRTLYSGDSPYTPLSLEEINGIIDTN